MTVSLRGIDATNEKDSYVRMRVFNGTNKLYQDKPILGVAGGKGTFKYYWFFSTGAQDLVEW